MYGQKRVEGGVGQLREPKLSVRCLRTSAHPFLAKNPPGAPVFGHCPLKKGRGFLSWVRFQYVWKQKGGRIKKKKATPRQARTRQRVELTSSSYKRLTDTLLIYDTSHTNDPLSIQTRVTVLNGNRDINIFSVFTARDRQITGF